jgi:hypothetical protein
MVNTIPAVDDSVDPREPPELEGNVVPFLTTLSAPFMSTG